MRLEVYYFAYGSNLSRRQMLERCPDALPRGTATLPNHRLIFAGWSRKWGGGVASIRPHRGDKVLGAIYEISDRCLRILDRYEDCPGTYERLNVTVFTDLGDPFAAVTYILAKQSEESRPSRDYLATIQEGYRDWELA